MPKRETHSASYLVRMTPTLDSDLRAMAEETGVSLSEAMREGAKLYYQQRLSTTLGGDDDLAGQLRAIATRIDSRISGS